MTFIVRVSYHATSKALSVVASNAMLAALKAGSACRGSLVRPTGYLVMRDGVNLLALTETEMQGLKNRQLVYANSLQRKEATHGPRK